MSTLGLECYFYLNLTYSFFCMLSLSHAGAGVDLASQTDRLLLLDTRKRWKSTVTRMSVSQTKHARKKNVSPLPRGQAGHRERKT